MTNKFPVTTLIAKSTWRYFRRLQALQQAHPCPPLGTVAKWLQRQQTNPDYTLLHGLQTHQQTDHEKKIYLAYLEQLRSDIRLSNRLCDIRLQELWLALLDLGLGGKAS